MAVGTTTMAVIGAVTAAAGVAGSLHSADMQRQQAQEQAKYQKNMAEYNAKIAEVNAKRSEEQGAEVKKEAHEASTRKKQETARIIGQQRAAQGAFGAQVDQGSSLDLNLDTAEKGALDAFQIEQQGAWEDYNKRVEAWNYRQQGAEILTKSQFTQEKKNPFLETGTTVLSGLHSAGKSLGKIF